MKKLRYLLIVHLLIVFNLQGHAQFISQQVIASTGGSGQNGEVQLSWTSGEPFIATFETDDFVLTQGFHQPPHIPSAILPGDANCDGAVDILDAVAVISYILENNPQPFCFENADINASGVVDILDAVAIINFILQGKTALPDLEINPAHIYLSAEGIDFMSDGTLAGLQLEFFGKHIPALKSGIPGFELITSRVTGGIKAVLIHQYGEALPVGKIRLIEFINAPSELSWGEVKGGNISAQYVPINKHLITEERTAEFTFLAYPNPAKSTLTLQIALPVASNVVFSLNDMLGRQNTHMMETFLEAGQHFLTFNITVLSPGVYTLNAIIKPLDKAFNTNQYHQKIIISR